MNAGRGKTRCAQTVAPADRRQSLRLRRRLTGGSGKKQQAKPPFVAPERSGGFAEKPEQLSERSEFCSGRKTSAERRGPAASGCDWRGALGPGGWAGNPLVAVRGRNPGFTVVWLVRPSADCSPK